MSNQPTPDRLRDHLAHRIAGTYATPPGLLTPDARRALTSFVGRIAGDGMDAPAECRRYVDWLEFANRDEARRTEQRPPHSAETACLDIATHYGKACAWSKFKQRKRSLLEPLPNPHLAPPTSAEHLATREEWAGLRADLAQRLGRMGGGA